MEIWEPTALRGSGKTNFLWQRERCRAVDTADYFSCFLARAEEGDRKESEKEREIKSTRVKLAQRAGFKTRDETATPVLAARGPPSSQPGPHRARRPHRREPDLMFHKEISLRGKGHGSCLCCRESESRLFAAKQTKMGVVTVPRPKLQESPA